MIKIPVFKRKCWFFLTVPHNEEFSCNYINLLQLMRQTHQPSKESLCSQIQKKPCVSLLFSQTGRTESGWVIIRPMDNFQTTRKPLTITLHAQNLFYPHSPSWPSSLSSAPARPQDASEWTVSSTIQQAHRTDKNAGIGQLNFKTRSPCWGFRWILLCVYFLK